MDVNAMIAEMDAILGHTFNNADLMIKACTHVTIDRNKNNEVLETLGDTVLGLYVVTELSAYEDRFLPTKINAFKSINLDNERLCRACYQSGLYLQLKHNISNFENRLELYATDLAKFKKHSNGRMNIIKDLADLLEATIGAVWLDSQNWKATADVIKKLLGPIILDDEVSAFRPVHQLWGLGLGKKRELEESFTVDSGGDFVCNIRKIKGREIFASAKYWDNGKALRNRAAFNALERIRELDDSKGGTNTIT